MSYAAQTIRQDALRRGGVDPVLLRFRIVEYHAASGKRLGVPKDDLSFADAVETTATLIERASNSHFCLEPVGFLQ